MEKILDCIIIGGGPGGLTAGIYLKRFRRDILIIDDQQSRAALIPMSHNYPGYPKGISGLDLLKQLKAQLGRYNGQIFIDTVQTIIKGDEYFQVKGMKENFMQRR